MNRGRGAIVLVMLLALLATAAARNFAQDRRKEITEDASQRTGVSQAGGLGAMPSYATALLLGGLRGPLVMVLWSTSENQKIEHNLQDFDTKVEWIRILQPEFDSVHMFQIWNKAYNISVQMASLANKYVTILDALEYAHRVDHHERPDDINIISAIAQVYRDKLSQSQEHVYYRRRVRRETQQLVRLTVPDVKIEEFREIAIPRGWDPGEAPMLTDEQSHSNVVLLNKRIADVLKPLFNGDGIVYEESTNPANVAHSSTWQRVRLDPMLDVDGNILPQLLEPRDPREARPANLAPDQDWYDSSELQCLAKYQPFPYGLSPMALAYNYDKRAQLLQELKNARHAQSSDTVIDSRPALSLRAWAEDEWERGRRAELRMWNLAATDDRPGLELPAATVPLNRPVLDPGARDLAIYSYAMAVRLFADAKAEYMRHVQLYPNGIFTYQSHIDDVVGAGLMLQGDYDSLKAMTAPQQAGPGVAVADTQAALLQDARENYNKAYEQYSLIILKYYTQDVIAKAVFPINPKTGEQYTRNNIDTADPSIYGPLMREMLQQNQAFFQSHNMFDETQEDRDEYMRYLGRINTRLNQIGRPATSSTTPATAPEH